MEGKNMYDYLIVGSGLYGSMFFAEVKCRLLQNAMYVGCCKIDLGGYTPKPL